MAVSAVWRLVYFLAPWPAEAKEQTAAHRRDALCPYTKIQKQADFGIISVFHVFIFFKKSKQTMLDFILGKRRLILMFFGSHFSLQRPW